MYFTGAQELDDDPSTCPIYVPIIEGNNIIVQDTSQEFVVQIPEELIEDLSHTYTLYSGESIVTTFSGAIFAYNFAHAGAYRLSYTQIGKDTGCTYTKDKSIHVYTNVITYIGPPSDEVSLGREGMSDAETYIHEISVEDMSIVRGEQFTNLLMEHSYYLQNAHTLLVDGEVVGPLFDRLTQLQQLAGLSIDADLYVLASINQSAFRRMIATYGDLLSVDTMYVVSKQYVGSLLTSLLLQKNTESLNFVKTYTVGLSSSNKIMTVSYLVDYLLYHNFPLGALLFILLLPVLVLLISIFRQVIGLSVFGVFYPVLFAFSLHILGIAPTILFLAGAFLTTLIVGYFTKRIYLLHSAKVSLLVVIYCLITLFLLWITNKYNIVPIDYSLFQNYYFLFPYLLILLVGNRIFTDQFYLFNAGRWIGLLEFALISLIIYRCISSQLLQNTILGFPEISLLCLLIIIIVGRFTGLQLLEYVRFMPLIKHYFEEEEE